MDRRAPATDAIAAAVASAAIEASKAAGSGPRSRGREGGARPVVDRIHANVPCDAWERRADDVVMLVMSVLMGQGAEGSDAYGARKNINDAMKEVALICKHQPVLGERVLEELRHPMSAGGHAGVWFATRRKVEVVYRHE